jgi:hypothetical protein
MEEKKSLSNLHREKVSNSWIFVEVVKELVLSDCGVYALLHHFVHFKVTSSAELWDKESCSRLRSRYY